MNSSLTFAFEPSFRLVLATELLYGKRYGVEDRRQVQIQHRKIWFLESRQGARIWEPFAFSNTCYWEKVVNTFEFCDRCLERLNLLVPVCHIDLVIRELRLVTRRKRYRGLL